ncbi:hypothetical protein AB0436_19935 [Streptomyces sp. NPDC051322]|uniref:hypothetical protein n=1 Tax=Streptomyces sp. NPDC051322 TaxID=3154645 RepID=UPI00344C80A4
MRRALRKTVLGAGATALAVIPALASPASAAGFTVYTNERNTITPGLRQYGAVKSTVVYDAFKFTCDAQGCYSNGGALPAKATYEATVQEYVSQFGGDASSPVVLDFENIVLTALSGQAATNAFNLWKQLITWTHEAVPSAPVGMYGYDWSTQNNSLIKQLHQNGLFDFFAPRAYWDSGETQSSWSSQLDQAIANDHSLAPGRPVYPYINPQQINGGYLSGSTWSYVMNQLKSKTEGAVVWEPSASDSSACNWVLQNSYEMGVITGTSSSGPLTATATAPSGSCVVPHGTTTTIPVTIKNTSGSTTAATTMQSFTGAPQGITGTWTYWNVPSLAPGATWTTALILTIPSSETWSTALFHLRTGLSDTRYAVIVQ